MPRENQKRVRVVKRFIGVNITEPEYAKVERAAKRDKRTNAFVLRELINTLP